MNLHDPRDMDNIMTYHMTSFIFVASAESRDILNNSDVSKLLLAKTD